MDVRVAAAKVLEGVIRQGRSLSVLLPLWQPKVTAKDRALLQELCYGVLRWYWCLDAITSQLLRKPFKPKDTDVKSLILIGLYQMLFLRVPDHAAVSTTVAATSGLKKTWARSLVNAVLRGFQRDHQQITARLETDTVYRYAHPHWLVEQLQLAYPEQWQSLLEANNQHPPMCLRINRRQLDREQYLEKLLQTEVQASPLLNCDQGVLLHQATEVESLPGYSAGEFSVQDGAAQLAAGLLAAEPGERILDACAAPGGKTAHVLELQPKLEEMVALDFDAGRLDRLEQNLQRLQLSATVVCGDAAKPESWWDGQAFDRILLDAPCSASGVIRRHPDIKVLRRESDITGLVRQQGEILRALWPLLKPGGMLLYVTCSVLPQENIQQLQTFFAEHEDAENLPVDAEWGVAQQIGRQILTGQDDMDGFYYACLRKQDVLG